MPSRKNVPLPPPDDDSPSILPPPSDDEAPAILPPPSDDEAPAILPPPDDDDDPMILPPPDDDDDTPLPPPGNDCSPSPPPPPLPPRNAKGPNPKSVVVIPRRDSNAKPSESVEIPSNLSNNSSPMAGSPVDAFPPSPAKPSHKLLRRDSSFSRQLAHGSRKSKKFGTFHALPHGWYEGFDSQGRKYYLHRRLKITQWDVPDEIMQYLPPLPPDWSERKDPHGKAFYVNMKLKKSQRARPGPRDAEYLEAALGPQYQRDGSPPFASPMPISSKVRDRKSSSSLSVEVPMTDIVVTPPPPEESRDDGLIQKYRVQIRTDDLLDGWKVVENKKKRRIFFYNDEQKKSRWDFPTIEPLPEGWSIRLDFATHRRYYVNTSTNQVVWRIPNELN